MPNLGTDYDHMIRLHNNAEDLVKRLLAAKAHTFNTDIHIKSILQYTSPRTYRGFERLRPRAARALDIALTAIDQINRAELELEEAIRLKDDIKNDLNQLVDKIRRLIE